MATFLVKLFVKDSEGDEKFEGMDILSESDLGKIVKFRQEHGDLKVTLPNKSFATLRDFNISFKSLTDHELNAFEKHSMRTFGYITPKHILEMSEVH